MSLNYQERERWLARNVLPHERLVRSRLRGLCVAGLEIDDVIQEMYARILSVPSIEAIRFPRQYAVQTAKSIIIDHLRRSRVVPIASVEALEQLNPVLPDVSTEERLEFQGQIQEVANALALLPPLCRETLILRRVEGLSQRQTAQRLGITESAVEHHMAEGVELLVELFGRGGKSRARSSTPRSTPRSFARVEHETLENGAVKQSD
jgi:RNA polymerase sigma factor (sigma-70 family)